MTAKKIYIGLSGGVDSSVAAALLKRAKHNVVGVFMKNWHDEEDQCPLLEDEKDVRNVCNTLDIPLEIIDLSQTYLEKVFQIMLSELKQGLTPNPDILCNESIKFHALLDHVAQQGADFLATGHYAGLCQYQDNLVLRLAKDKSKDQTYFLSRLPRHALNKICFPLGNMTKDKVREFARSIGLQNSEKKDSTGICFIGEKKFSSFISQYLLDKPGLVLTSDGEIIGEHRGLFFHTIGQRKGLKIGGVSGKDEQAWYVVAKNIEDNTLIVAQGKDNSLLFSTKLHARNIQWHIDLIPNRLFKAFARIRHMQEHQACEVIWHSSDNSATIVFEKAQRAITPGQYVAIYKDNIVIGNGQIHLCKTEKVP
ncbi:MAG: tRNA 2-thiouridine(34) synthase MnmA [Pseudomonadota bacterium]|nr:tRNA 2-thiouridine(34) synthase MnmA [Pseudomonadota bacterium]